MQLSNRITAIKTAWAAAIPTVPLYYQLAPENTLCPFAVLRIGPVTPGEQDITNKDWEATATIVAYETTDTAILTLNDSIVNLFERGSISGFYSSTVQSAEVDFNYGDQMAVWSSAVSVSLLWTI
jgi:hypothetical protein